MKNTPITFYNLVASLKVMEHSQAEVQRVIHTFMEAIRDKMNLPEGQSLKLFLCPAQEFHADDYLPFQNPNPRKKFWNDILSGVMWVALKNDSVATHFPYSICFTKTSIAFDAGPFENPTEAAQIVYDVICEDNYVQISAMTNPQNLVEKYIAALLPEAVPTTM